MFLKNEHILKVLLLISRKTQPEIDTWRNYKNFWNHNKILLAGSQSLIVHFQYKKLWHPKLTWQKAVYSLYPLTVNMCTVSCRNNTALLMGCCSQPLQQCIWFIYHITFLKSIKFWIWNISGCKGLGIMDLYCIITAIDVLLTMRRSVPLQGSHTLRVTKHSTWKGPERSLPASFTYRWNNNDVPCWRVQNSLLQKKSLPVFPVRVWGEGTRSSPSVFPTHFVPFPLIISVLSHPR